MVYLLLALAAASAAAPVWGAVDDAGDPVFEDEPTAAAPDEREVWALARAAVNAPEPAPGEVVPAAEYVRLARAALAARPMPVVSEETHTEEAL